VLGRCSSFRARARGSRKRFRAAKERGLVARRRVAPWVLDRLHRLSRAMSGHRERLSFAGAFL